MIFLRLETFWISIYFCPFPYIFNLFLIYSMAFWYILTLFDAKTPFLLGKIFSREACGPAIKGGQTDFPVGKEEYFSPVEICEIWQLRLFWGEVVVAVLSHCKSLARFTQIPPSPSSPSLSTFTITITFLFITILIDALTCGPAMLDGSTIQMENMVMEIIVL